MFDFVIVGAGASGCVLANRLSADPEVQVLLVEAGGGDRGLDVSIPAASTKLFQSKRDWSYWTVPQEHLDGRRIFWPRGRMLGGSTSMNFQMYIRGHRQDYDDWASADSPGWSWPEVLPLFRRSERNSRGRCGLHGGDGELHVCDQRDPNALSLDFVDAAIASGLKRLDDLCLPELEGVGLPQVTQYRGRRWSASDAFLRPAMARKNLRVRRHCHVARVRFDSQSRAKGLELVGGETIDAAVTICCAGAVNTPQLLLCSGIGPVDELETVGISCAVDLPGVGRNLSDHLCYALFADVDSRRTLAAAERPAELLRYLLTRRGLLSSGGGEAAAFVRSDGGRGAPDIELIFLPVPFENQGIGKPTRHAITLTIELLTPESRGTVRLVSSDPRIAPIINPAYLSDAEKKDQERLLAGYDIAEKILRSSPLRERIVSDFGTDDRAAYLRRIAQTVYHPVGTCKMGSAPDAVVDTSLRVHETENLLIADVSVMPTVNRGHTQAPAMMIAERCADLLLAA